MDRPSEPVSTRVLVGGVIAPLLVGSFVPVLSEVALLWLLLGLATLMVQAVGAAVRRVDPGEQTWDDAWDDAQDTAGDDASGGHAADRAQVREPAVPGRWWHRTLEDPNTAAARAGSWG